jgi:hypothetical protein
LLYYSSIIVLLILFSHASDDSMAGQCSDLVRKIRAFVCSEQRTLEPALQATLSEELFEAATLVRCDEASFRGAKQPFGLDANDGFEIARARSICEANHWRNATGENLVDCADDDDCGVQNTQYAAVRSVGTGVRYYDVFEIEEDGQLGEYLATVGGYWTLNGGCFGTFNCHFIDY